MNQNLKQTLCSLELPMSKHLKAHGMCLHICDTYKSKWRTRLLTKIYSIITHMEMVILLSLVSLWEHSHNL